MCYKNTVIIFNITHNTIYTLTLKTDNELRKITQL